MLLAKSNNNNNNDKQSGDKEEIGMAEEGGEELEFSGISQALTTTDPPEVFSDVPVLAIGRNPLFPRFVKMLEVPVVVKLMILFDIVSFN